MKKVLIKPWQKYLVSIIALLGRFQLFILSVLVTEKGTPASTKEAPVLVIAPHSTIVDGFFMLYHGYKNKGY